MENQLAVVELRTVVVAAEQIVVIAVAWKLVAGEKS